MEKISVKELIDFRRKTERSKRSFALKLKTREAKKKENSQDDGGNYWASCISAIGNVFKTGNLNLLDEKIEDLYNRKKGAELERVKNGYQRNIDIITGFADFDFDELKPNVPLKFLHKSDSILNVNGFPIYVNSRVVHVFSFSIDEKEAIGAVAFIAIKDGYEHAEIGIFTNILYRYLNIHYSKDYYINTKYCIVVDVVTGRKATYREVEEGKIPSLLEKTIDEIKRM